MRRVVLLFAIAVAIAGCRGKAASGASAQERRNAGAPARDPAAELAEETALLKDAQDSVAELMKHAGDCEAVGPAFAATYRKLDGATRKVRTPDGKATLEALTKQAATVKGACE